MLTMLHFQRPETIQEPQSAPQYLMQDIHLKASRAFQTHSTADELSCLGCGLICLMSHTKPSKEWLWSSAQFEIASGIKTARALVPQRPRIDCIEWIYHDVCGILNPTTNKVWFRWDCGPTVPSNTHINARVICCVHHIDSSRKLTATFANLFAEWRETPRNQMVLMQQSGMEWALGNPARSDERVFSLGGLQDAPRPYCSCTQWISVSYTQGAGSHSRTSPECPTWRGKLF